MIHVDSSFQTMGYHERIMVFPFTLEDFGVAFTILRILPALKRAAIQVRPEIEGFITWLFNN